MNITQEKIDDLNAVLNVEVKQDDYASNVLNMLKKQQRSAKMAGFRPGKVPFGLVKKMYEPAVKVEEINKLVSNSLQQYIVENKIDVLGQPLPKMEGEEFDWQNQQDFSFKYEMGLAPEFDVKLDKKLKLTTYKVSVDETLVDKYVGEVAKRYGKMINPESSVETDLVYGEFTELDEAGNPKEEGASKLSTVAIERVPEKARKQFVGLSKDQEIKLDPRGVYEKDEEVAALLGVKAEELANLSKEFSFKVSAINRLEEADLDQDLFDKVYGAGTVTSVEEFRERVKEESTPMIANQEEVKLKDDFVHLMLDKIQFDLPDEFLKKWLAAANEKPVSLEEIESEYSNYQRGLKWQLIENKIIKDNELKVEPAEVEEKAKELIRANFKQYGQEVDEEQLGPIVQNVLAKEEERRGIYDNLYFDKILDLVKENCKIEEKSISYDDFLKLASEHKH